MIRIGITGAGSLMAGELIRLLINHPDVEILWLYDSKHNGKAAETIHHGLIGEAPLAFTMQPDWDKVKLLFRCDDTFPTPSQEKMPELRVVDLSQDTALPEDMNLGLSEINRKTLVRDAKRTYIPTAAASVILTVLYPLATHLMLKPDTEIAVTLPQDMLTKDMEEKTITQIRHILHKVQSSFDSAPVINWEGVADWEHFRLMRVAVEIDTDLDVEEAVKIYDSIYDDHNFTHIIRRNIKGHEAEGTQKVIISITKTEEHKLRLEAVADPRMRGGAGDAVHVMNLLFGLHEKTGLALKASWY